MTPPPPGPLPPSDVLRLCENCASGNHVTCWRLLHRRTDCNCPQYCSTLLDRALAEAKETFPCPRCGKPVVSDIEPFCDACGWVE